MQMLVKISVAISNHLIFHVNNVMHPTLCVGGPVREITLPGFGVIVDDAILP